MSHCVGCVRVVHEPRRMSHERASELYQRLRPFLRVVPSWGCYTPARGRRRPGDHSAWPLHRWRGPGHFPLVVEWDPNAHGIRNGEKVPTPPLTFAQFLAVYRIEVADAV